MIKTKRFFATITLTLIVLAGPLLAQTKTPLADLQKKIRQTSQYSIPRTVLITVYVRVGMTFKKGYGSGGIISKDGYILTCSHVIELGKKVEVTLSNGRVYRAKKMGRNRKQDYALIKINPSKSLPFFPIGDSQKLKIGQWVVAFGHPGGPYPDRKPAVSTGVITGINRVLVLRQNGKFYNHAIRTDVPIFMGNSGGPLVDLSGKLIGINGAIIMLNKNSYAVPIHQIMAKIAQLKKGTVLDGKAPSFLDMQKMRSEIGPRDMGRIYKNILKKFYRITLGKVVKTIKKWWQKIFSGNKKR